MEHDDFVIQILLGEGDVYQVRIESPAGRGEGRFEIPSGLELLPGEPLSRPRDFLRTPAPFGTASPSEAGDRLFRALFQGKVLSLFHQSLGRAQVTGRRLRIRLRIDPKLGLVWALPWELLYHAETQDFLGMTRSTTVVRSLDVHRAIDPAALDGRLRVLVVVSSPEGYDNLELERECDLLEKSWRDGRPGTDVVFLRDAGRRGLRKALLSQPCHVLHFMGHGTFDPASGEGALVLERQEGGPDPVRGPDLAAELKSVPSLRLVVLNACHTGRMAEDEGLHPFSGVAAALIQGGLPAVVAMRSQIPDRSAIAFSETFYERFAAGDPVDLAVAEGRLAIQREGGADGAWSLPVLFIPGPEEVALARNSWLRAGIAIFVALCLAVLLALFLQEDSESVRQEAQELNNAGFALAQEGQPTEARAKFESALRVDPGYAPPHANLALLEAEQGRYPEALEHARKAVELAPKEASYQYNLGSLLAHVHRHEEALHSLREAADLEPCHSAAYNELGNSFLALDRAADAREAIGKGLRCDPRFAPLHKNLARAALKEGKTQEAIRSLEVALPLYELGDAQGKAEAYYWLAEARAQANQREKACEALVRLRSEGIAEVWPWAEAKKLAQQLGCDGVF